MSCLPRSSTLDADAQARAQFDSFAAPGGAFLVGDPGTVAKASDALSGLSRISFQMSAASGNRKAMLRSIELLGRSVARIIRKHAEQSRACVELSERARSRTRQVHR